VHGEYKTPGGKLVVVDFEVANDALTNVAVSGDFFLYPEDALRPITAALEGVPVASTSADIAGVVHAAISDTTELLGTSPEGIAIAVQRALQTAPELSHR